MMMTPPNLSMMQMITVFVIFTLVAIPSAILLKRGGHSPALGASMLCAHSGGDRSLGAGAEGIEQRGLELALTKAKIRDSGQIALLSSTTGWSSTQLPSVRCPSGVIITPGPLRLPSAYTPSNSASATPFCGPVQNPLSRRQAILARPRPGHRFIGLRLGIPDLAGDLFLAMIQLGVGPVGWA